MVNSAVRLIGALCLLAGLASSPVLAQSDVSGFAREVESKVDGKADTAYAEQARRAAEDYARKNETSLRDLAKAATPTEPTAAFGAQKPVGVPRGDRYRIFVSQTMPAAELGALAAAAAKDPQVTLVLMGYLPGQSPAQMMARVRGWTSGAALGSIQIDPPAFHALRIVAVPSVARYNAKGEPIAWASGTSSVTYLNRLIAGGRRGNVGRVGPAVAVAERDLMAELKARVAKIDWSKEQRRAESDYWAHLPQSSLPAARRDRVRRIDPSFVVTRTITAPDGRVVALAGQRLNPLAVLPFRQHVLVFDGRDPAQVRWAQLVARGTKAPVTLVATQLPVTTRAGYLDWIAAFGSPVTLLNDALRDRFALEAVPARIRGGQGVYLVEEFTIAGRMKR